jgi:hypothetical protein
LELWLVFCPFAMLSFQPYLQDRGEWRDGVPA